MRKKECDKLLSPNVRSAFGLLQSVLAPILPTRTDAPLATLTNETRQMADIMANEDLFTVFRYVNNLINNN